MLLILYFLYFSSACSCTLIRADLQGLHRRQHGFGRRLLTRTPSSPTYGTSHPPSPLQLSGQSPLAVRVHHAVRGTPTPWASNVWVPRPHRLRDHVCLSEEERIHANLQLKDHASLRRNAAVTPACSGNPYRSPLASIAALYTAHRGLRRPPAPLLRLVFPSHAQDLLSGAVSGFGCFSSCSNWCCRVFACAGCRTP